MSGLLTYSQHTSHPTAPTTGNHHLYFYSDGKLYRMDSSGTPVEVGAAGGGGATTVRKTADESVTSSTTLQDDDHLFFPIGVSEAWAFEFIVFYTGDAAGDIQFAITVPAGFSLLRWSFLGLSPSLATLPNTTLLYPAITASGTANSFAGTVTGADTMALIKGIVVNGATSGNVKLQWAQNSSNASATTVRSGSYLIANQTT